MSYHSLMKKSCCWSKFAPSLFGGYRGRLGKDVKPKYVETNLELNDQDRQTEIVEVGLNSPRLKRRLHSHSAVSPYVIVIFLRRTQPFQVKPRR